MFEKIILSLSNQIECFLGLYIGVLPSGSAPFLFYQHFKIAL
jgi:hypothetical protein